MSFSHDQQHTEPFCCLAWQSMLEIWGDGNKTQSNRSGGLLPKNTVSVTSKKKIMRLKQHGIMKDTAREDVGSREGEEKAGSAPIQLSLAKVSLSCVLPTECSAKGTTQILGGSPTDPDFWWSHSDACLSYHSTL